MKRILTIASIVIFAVVACYLFGMNIKLTSELKSKAKEVDQISKEFNRVSAERLKFREDNIKQKIAVEKAISEKKDLEAKIAAAEKAAAEKEAGPEGVEAPAVSGKPQQAAPPADKAEADKLKAQLEELLKQKSGN